MSEDEAKNLAQGVLPYEAELESKATKEVKGDVVVLFDAFYVIADTGDTSI